ncbi:MAG: fasciclin domain-containing protein [Bacteroidales bacterium]|nr:fasciclin domain-containing protein [Bacteroidales bacterium]MBN2699632.1 fasciclin domain-containing protein [Bacteroidales bacterium]
MIKKQHYHVYHRGVLLTAILVLTGLWLVSCVDEYTYDDEEPEWLGASIYDYLKTDGNFTNYVRLIDDVGYTAVLAKTGSKTLFVASDSAFDRFFSNNPWGVSNYDDLTLSEKKLILNFGMINNAYLIETLANYNGPTGLNYGTAIRRESAVSVLDTVPLEPGHKLPDNPFWDRFRNNGLFLLKDDSPYPLVHFLPIQLLNANISDDDFLLITREERSGDDAFIFNNRVVERDITCKNGYVHVLEDVLIPRVNMAQHLTENPETETFSRLLERFSAPYFSEQQTYNFKQIHPEFNDSIFVKEYFSDWGGQTYYPDNTPINEEYLLPFNPGWNSYVRQGSESSLQSDMASILAPTDAALDNYFNSGSGIILKNRYGSWDNVPDDIIILFLRRHLRESFLESIPSRFDKMTDSENSPIPIVLGDLVDSYVGVNGVVYMTNSVYPPDDYVSVYGPVLFSEYTRVFNWAIRQNDFRLYLNSLISTYSFFVPTDEYFENYIDPIAYSKDVKGALKFWYNDETSTVNATVYSYDPVTGEVGDSINTITHQGFLSNRLLDLLDTHIIVGDVESGSGNYLSKGGRTILTEGSGMDMEIRGGGDIEQDVVTHVTAVFEQQNGRTYFIDKPIQTPLRSVYKILSETPEFSAFFNLLSGFPTNSESVIFKKTNNYYGIDFNIKFFNTFHYTVYVPTNEAIQQAISDGLIKNWDMINEIADPAAQNDEIKKLERFLRYHFQDNSVYLSGSSIDKLYQTATIKNDSRITRFNTFLNKYYKLKVNGSGNDLTITTELTDRLWTAQVITENNLYNIMTRDYIFSGNPLAFKEIDDSGTGLDFPTSEIRTSSTAVIHQIDNVLRFE